MSKKLSAKEVLDILDEEGQVTVNGLAKTFSVSSKTVKNRLRELRRDGECIIHDKNGILLVDKEMIQDDIEIAQSLSSWIDWILKTFSGLMICVKPATPLLPTMRKSLGNLSKEERKMLSKSCIRIKGLLDYVEVEEEDEERKVNIIRHRG